MSELALYRKYRPSKFSEVIGQESVVQVLSGALKLGNIAHAYLFAGSRGTGKTSVARILARELETQPEDLYEIDGASNRGIDEIRALREAVGTLPFRSPRKVYIIDEVHMLTKEAFNALLKILEEPPSHVVFILATTELERVPETIISRCQTFAFQKPSQPALQDLLQHIAKQEKFKLDKDAGELIALLGDGSFRDVTGLLQQAMSASSDHKITLAEAELVTGAPAAVLVRRLAQAILENNLSVALEQVQASNSRSYSAQTLIKLLLRQLRLALLVRLDDKNSQTIWLAGLSADEINSIKKLSEHENASRLPEILRELLAAHTETAKAAVSLLPLELALVKLAKPV
ncbi:MAG: DNA polymerase III subunit gamma/tau [Patescibacteria group bacterium]